MANNIVQLTDYDNNNIYPIAGAAAQGSITKSMLEEGVFEGPELSQPSSVAYVATDNIQDGAVTSDKIDFATYTSNEQIVGEWLNGKTIYRKTYEGTAINSSEVVIANLGTTLTAIKIEGWYYSTASGFTQPIGQYSTLGSNYTSRIFYDKSGGYLKAQFGTGIVGAGFALRAIIEYTKD